MQPNSFLPVFEHLNAQNNGDMIVIGDTLLVEPVQQAPATKDVETADGKKVSIILETKLTNRQVGSVEDDRPLFVRVLACGSGYYDDETGKDLPLETQPGDIILMGKLSVRWLSTFGPLLREGDRQIGICRESDSILRFKGQAGFDRVNQILAEAK